MKILDERKMLHLTWTDSPLLIRGLVPRCFIRKNLIRMNRKDNLHRVRNRRTPWDIIVIGGGATGVGCALDAASRGLDVLLLEQHDLGKGTSSRSTKLVHGGVRYLEQGNISLVREALKERGMLLRNAPHVVHKQAFVVPCYSHWEKFYYGVGLKIYDLLSGKYSFGRSRILSRSEVIGRLGTIRTDGLTGGILYYDGQFDDTRLLIDMAVTATGLGATVLNYARVLRLKEDESGRILGVEFSDELTGDKFTAAGKVVINATGAFCDSIRSMHDPAQKPLVTLSQGIHLVFDRKFLWGDTAIMIPKTSDGRVLFCIPWHGHTLVGTTDTPIDHAMLEPKALGAEIDFILETAGEYLDKTPSRSDILSVFAGIRPLVRSDAIKKTSSLSRSHLIEADRAGMVTITGGKWTTYRRMAEETVDIASQTAGLNAKASKTADLAIKSARSSTTETRYLHPDLPYTVEDVINAVRNELALTVEDVLARRTRALFLDARAAIEIAPRVAEIIALETENTNYDAEQDIENFRTIAKLYLG